MKIKAFLLVSILVNLALIALILYSKLNAKVDNYEPEVPVVSDFSIPVIIDLYTSVGSQEILNKRLDFASRLILINTMLDEDYTAPLPSLYKKFLIRALVETSSADEIKKILRSNFEGVTTIEVNEESEGFRKVYFYGENSQNNIFVGWGVKRDLFYETDNTTEVKDQIENYINLVLDEINGLSSVEE